MRSRFRSFADVESFVVKVEDFSYWPCGPMDKASVYGTGDCRFESYQGQLIETHVTPVATYGGNFISPAKIKILNQPLWRNG